MRIVDIREGSLPISRYADPGIPSGGLTTSLVAVVTDQYRDRRPVIGYGFASIGRFAQGGLIRERFAPRLLSATDADLHAVADDNIDPLRCWHVMMRDEKPGGHGERCVAVGALDMAIWDAAAKIAGQPLYRFLAARLGRDTETPQVSLYASGGYPYPVDDLAQLGAEIRRFLDQGYRRVKIKIGSAPPDQDLRRIDTVLKLLPSADCLAVDAMNRYDAATALAMTRHLASLDLMWSEDLCDPLDFSTLSELARIHPAPLAAGEALFSRAETALLLRHGGLRPDRDILLFDPAHCYGLTHYLQIIETCEIAGWARRAFWPHGGHLFSLHLAAALSLGGSEVNPAAFQPIGGLADHAIVLDGQAVPPELPGIGIEGRASFARLFADL